MAERDSFRGAMRRMAATVCVLSTQHHGGRFGITVSSVASLTLEPPTLCFGVRRTSPFCQPMIDSGWLCVNVLSREQEAIGRVFATPPAGEHRFETGEWFIHDMVSETAVEAMVRLPCLVRAQANLVCRLDRTIAHGTHYLCLAEVEHVLAQDRIAPLLYCDGDYHELAPPSGQPPASAHHLSSRNRA
ncbi:flavin reductase family protein [Bradyrhizobium prioriisuperbiae]|uniref:flavin reductase family protein n=1 Tax=Bradyrhizobium prioriisuperbiae TaxID=2854389 RepID=UPI0028E252FF|nr:flavin reductase family protein [Bradyrhizobium prioritasuperba]